MRHSRLAGVAAGVLIAAVLAPSPPATASVPTHLRPCGGLTLWATNAASAESFDNNGDRLECHPSFAASKSLDPYVTGRDNRKLPLSTGFKFYSFDGTGRTAVTSVRPSAHRFTAYVAGQEDDPDMNGCSGICFETLRYDRNDFFYVDTGKGSRRVSMATFGSRLHCATRFSMIYEPRKTGRSVFSLDLTVS